MFGLLNIGKPSGITSRDVVNRVQRFVRPHKVGHAGTLDPLATGVLVVSVGHATRLIEYVQQMPKHYVGTFLLGRSSDTEDVEGQVVELPNAQPPSEEALRAALPQFTGVIQQMPPAYSALKVAGQRAYALARRGEQVELQARPITVHRLELLDYDYPQFTLDIHCGSGTYVRSLGRDIARAVGSEAVMSALVRRAIGPFTIADALPHEAVTADSIAQHLQPAQLALAGLPMVELSADEIRELGMGRRIAGRPGIDAPEIGAIDTTGALIALLRSEPDGRLQPTRFFPQ